MDMLEVRVSISYTRYCKGQITQRKDRSIRKRIGSVSAQIAETKANGPVVEVMTAAYKPNRVEAELGKPITITFIRRSEQGCGTEVVFPDLKIKKQLPLNKPVKVAFTPQKRGEIRFTCAMDMFDGKVVVR